MNNEQKKLPHVVIIGGGFGGIQAALHLGKAPVRVTVIDRRNHHLFQPLLYQVATAALAPGDISVPIRHVLKKQGNTEVLMAEVTGIDTKGKRVLMHERALSYDYLIVATGASENYFGHEEWCKLAPGLKTIEDARLIRQKMLLAFETAELESDPERIKKLLTFVVVGAGPTGVELAGDMAEIAHKVLISEFRHIDPAMTRIVLVESNANILAAFPEMLSRRAHRKLRRLGVEVRTGQPVTEIDEDGVKIGEERIEAQMVVWTAGVTASPAGQWLGTETDRAGRVKVREDLSVPGLPEVFVIGDTASLVAKDGKPLPGLAPVAIQEGRYVARVISRRVKGETEAMPAFRYFDKGTLATIGRAYSILKIGNVQISGLLAWIVGLVVHMLYLIGFENRVLVMLQWAWAYLAFKRGARIIAEPNGRLVEPVKEEPEQIGVR